MPLTDNSYSDWLHDGMEKLNIRKANEVGLSLGGWMALYFAIKRRDKVIGLLFYILQRLERREYLFYFCFILWVATITSEDFLIGEGHALVKVTREVYIFYFIMN